MTRPTSWAAYNHLVASGGLPERQAEIYDIVWHHGPGTSAEIAQRAGREWTQSDTRSRWSELVKKGVLQEVGERSCQVTGYEKIVYEVTDRVMPLDIDRQEASMEEALRRAVDRFACREGTEIDAHRVVTDYYAEQRGIPLSSVFTRSGVVLR